jgi:hypothetical protein
MKQPNDNERWPQYRGLTCYQTTLTRQDGRTCHGYGVELPDARMPGELIIIATVRPSRIKALIDWFLSAEYANL